MENLRNRIQQIWREPGLISDGVPDRAYQLESLGDECLNKYDANGDIMDLEEAIHLYQESLNLTPDDQPDRSRRLGRLGHGFETRGNRTGAMSDLEMAIQRYQESLDLTTDDHPERAHQLGGLGDGYRNRYLTGGAMADLETSIQLYQNALDLTPHNHQDRAFRVQSLGTGYQERYRRTDEMSDLEAATQQFQDALDLIPNNHPHRAYCLYSLGGAYLDLYRIARTMDDLETAIEHLQEALNLTPDDDRDRARQLKNLGDAHREKYHMTRETTHLEMAIQLSREALDLTPDDHPERAQRLQSLGIQYQDKYEASEATSDFEMAIQQYEQALAHSSSPASERLPPGQELMGLYAEAELWLNAYQASNTTMSLIPLLANRSLENSDKQYFLSEVSNMASDATAIALMAGKTAYDAIQFLELGRGVIIGSLNETRGDMSMLQEKHPLLAEAFIQLRGRLDSPRSLMQPHANQFHDAGQKLDTTIQTIRELPGFDRFLLPPSEDELTAIASEGPIVLVNVSYYRCDALIIEKGGLRTLPLSSLTRREVEARAMSINKADKELLEWLWKTIGNPILSALGFTKPPTEGNWPRIWWIPTGPLCTFPIHAAGYHSNNSTETVLDRVISSYSSSVRVLISSRQNRSKMRVHDSQRAILVGMHELRYAPQEIDKIEDLCNSMHLHAIRPRPYRNDVLCALNDCKIFHFAGHGHSNQSDPSESSLLLSDRSLTVASLFELKLQIQGPYLAYLSACGTGQTIREELVDEGLHLVGACQLAGFQNVIGTLWEVNDSSCVDVAVRTYEWIKSQDMRDESVSEGLHHAIRNLRGQWILDNTTGGVFGEGIEDRDDKNGKPIIEQPHLGQGKERAPRDAVLCEDPPLHWVPYVHFGV
ncbi:TPR domain-containing protein [Ilyonectria destructans]|nr:TPR domain-containing protein [Ilyonectria destructans]